MASCRDNYYVEDCNNYNYSDCNTTEPSLAGLNIKLTINAQNPEVLIEIFKGKYEENNLVYSELVNVEKFSVLLPPSYYSVRATYRKGNETVYAIDGDKCKINYTQVCDSLCWDTDEGYLNLELK